MKYEFRFTFIIPHYNSFDTLRVLLNSIGLHDGIQIIVVDDRSDDSMEELDDLKLEYPYIEFLQNNMISRSAGACRNIGLDYAKGKWVVFADADDYFENGFFDILDQYYESDSDMIFFSPVSRDRYTNEISNRHIDFQRYIQNYKKNPTDSTKLELRYKFITVWSKMIKLSVIRQNNIRFDEILVANDVMFSIKCGYYAKNICASEEKIYCCTKGKSTLTTCISKERQDIRIDVFCNMCKYLKERLSKDEWKKLNLRGAPLLLYLIKNIRIFGFVYILKVVLKFARNFIPIVTIKDSKKFFKKVIKKS